MNQVPVLDSLRAIAAWSVCLYHFVCSTIGLFAPGRLTDMFYYGQYGIHVFFVISGFVIPWSMYHSQYRLRSFFKFVLKRFTRIEPPYIASLVLILLIAFIKSSLGYGAPDTYGQPITPARIFLHFGYLINFFPQYAWLNGVYWTLAIEFQYYLIMALMFLLFVHKNNVIRWTAYGLCFAMSLLVPDEAHAHFPFFAPLFLFGIIAFLKMISRINALEFWGMFALCAVFNYFYDDAPSAYIGGATALTILWWRNVKLPVLHGLGKISYSTYLVHPVLGASVINILSHRAAEPWQKWGIVGLGIIVTLGSSFIMYRLVEKPFKKLASSIRLQP